MYMAVALSDRETLKTRTLNFLSTGRQICGVAVAREYIPVSGILEAIAKDLGSIPGVQNVDVEEDAEGEYTVHIRVKEPEKELRYRIYSKELSIMDAFPDVLFDFRLAEAS